MLRPRSVLFGLFAVLAALPTAVEAQGRSCRSVLPSDFRRIINTRGEEIVYFRDPVRFLCSGNVLLEADSAVMNRGASAVELVGNVVYRDSTRELQADWANYLGAMDQLLTRGSTVVRDLVGGAVVEGEQLNYLRESRSRPIARMVVTGGRPYAVIPPRRDDAHRAGPAAETPPPQTPLPNTRPPNTPPPNTPPPNAEPPRGDTSSAPTEVWANRMEFEGEDIFRAEGKVDLKRGDMVGAGQRALFDQAAETMTLTGSAFVQNPSYRLDGDTINAFLQGEGLREVRSRGSARVTSEELKVRAQQVRIGFAAGELERLEAWNPDAGTGPRARAEARDFRMRADSIDAQADSLGIRELRAVGRAYGERDVDEEAARPQGEPVSPPGRLPTTLSRDWIQGDTILGFFTRSGRSPRGEAGVGEGEAESRERAAPVRPEVMAGLDGPGETSDEEDEVVLERIVVIGGTQLALSLYRMTPDEGSSRPAINFMKARRIVLFMERGELARVEAEGPIEGLYMDPTGVGAGEGGARPGAAGGEEAGR